MSYQAKLQIQFYDIKEEQMSPLIFDSLPACAEFGNIMFEPPDTVKSWECVLTDKKANAHLFYGVVRMI
jgi:hypothetical protein